MISWIWLIPTFGIGLLLGWRAIRSLDRYFARLYNDHCNTTSGVGPTAPPTILSARDRTCAYVDCKAVTGSDWDDMCIDHSLYLDGGRP